MEDQLSYIIDKLELIEDKVLRLEEDQSEIFEMLAVIEDNTIKE